MLLEIAVTSSHGVAIAAREGADRVELTTALELGGLTPSQGLMEAGMEAAGGAVEVHPLIRCRPGDFLYSADELSLMEREIRALLGQGASGVVVGALTADGEIDREALLRLSAAAREVRDDAALTLHRAIDQAQDAERALDTVIGLGFTRVLSSGQQATVAAGLEQLGRMRRHGQDRIQIMAGGGLSLEDIPAVRTAGLDAVHLSAKKVISTAQGGTVSLGAADGADPTAYLVTDAAVVRAARKAIDS
ncbi:copper homeostasis protein [Arthrobacter woluwensis]|uniref:copper homeostasis protein CutC n=1 Tax=Arthrobacter woluwensis TaxID=156980 RepID=UPI002786A628|nr:copper homeostasis protein CutC [Arthrobacter woluwensis]MDQ0707866.1 copper homeostasis protein [Arthrobacter woluwensis]